MEQYHVLKKKKKNTCWNFGWPYLGKKTTAAPRAALPIPTRSVCSILLSPLLQAVVCIESQYLGIFNVLADADAHDIAEHESCMHAVAL